MLLQKLTTVLQTEANDKPETVQPVRLPKLPKRKNSLSSLFRSRRKPGHRCCARRGCLCQAPEPYPVAPGSQNDSLPSLASVASVSATSSFFEARYTKQPLSWTKLQQKLSTEPALGTLLGGIGKGKTAVQDFLLKNPCSFAEVIESDAEAEEGKEDSGTVPDDVSMVVQEQAPVPSSAPPLVFQEKSNDSKTPPLANEDEETTKRERRRVRAAAREQRQLSDKGILPLSSEDATIQSYKEIAKKRIMHMREKRRQEQEHGNLVQRKYDALPIFEKELLEMTFKRCDTAGSGGVIGATAAMECLWEIGLYGKNSSEKRELLHICRDASTAAKLSQNHLISTRNQLARRRKSSKTRGRSWSKLRATAAVAHRVSADSQAAESSGSEEFDVGISSKRKSEDGAKDTELAVDLNAFAILIVPGARQKLTDLRSHAILRHFDDFDNSDRGEVLPVKCLQASICLGLDQIMLVKTLESHGFGRNEKKGVDFYTFQKCVMSCREERERRIRQWEWKIKSDNEISSGLFKALRSIISHAYQVFASLSHLSHAGSGSRDVITSREALFALRGLGCLPAGPEDRSYVAEALLPQGDVSYADEERHVLDDKAEMSFEEFLLFVQAVHSHWRMQNREALWVQFRSLDTDHNGTLSMEELSALLEDLEYLPHTRREQEELAQVISSVDIDGNGHLDFEEFQALLHRIETKFASLRFEVELQHAIVSGFSILDTAEFRELFDYLDADGSGTLEAGEIRSCLHILKKPISTGEFEQVFQNLDTQKGGCISFVQFIDFMALVRENEGAPSEIATRLPKDVAKLDDNILRWALERLNMPKSYLLAIDHQGLIALFCEMFEVSEREDDLPQRLKVKTLSDLLQLSNSKAETVLGR